MINRTLKPVAAAVVLANVSLAAPTIAQTPAVGRSQSTAKAATLLTSGDTGIIR